jgi:DNA-binding response OmpR family regulator
MFSARATGVWVMRILVIDDVHHVGAAIKAALEVANHDVLAVETGPLGVRAFDEKAFDAAIVDVFMLEMDGMTLIKELRRRAPRLPIVVISGGTYGATALDILITASGLTGVAYLQKPFRPEQLIAALDKAVRGAG